jgi:hypothetical protein
MHYLSRAMPWIRYSRCASRQLYMAELPEAHKGEFAYVSAGLCGGNTAIG